MLVGHPGTFSRTYLRKMRPGRPGTFSRTYLQKCAPTRREAQQRFYLQVDRHAGRRRTTPYTHTAPRNLALQQYVCTHATRPVKTCIDGLRSRAGGPEDTRLLLTCLPSPHLQPSLLSTRPVVLGRPRSLEQHRTGRRRSRAGALPVHAGERGGLGGRPGGGDRPQLPLQALQQQPLVPH